MEEDLEEVEENAIRRTATVSLCCVDVEREDAVSVVVAPGLLFRRCIFACQKYLTIMHKLIVLLKMIDLFYSY